MFTIEVGKKGKDEEFDFEDLEMYHKECMGGRIKQEPYSVERELANFYHVFNYFKRIKSKEEERGIVRNFWKLTCQRCAASIEIEIEPEFQATQVIAIAIGGEERKITNNITVIQKI